MKKITAVLIVMILIVAAMPMSLMAAPAADIPAEMLDNAYLDALAYTGYNVAQQKNDGTIFVKYSNNAPKSVLSGITHNTACSGLETNVSGVPDIEKFKSSGLCCASYVSYVYFNYLPNVAHIDTSSFSCPSNPRSAAAYNTAANEWVNGGKARRISFTQNTNGSNFIASEGIPLGALVVFKNIASGAVAHVAIYAGYYNGHHFVTHVGNDNGPELCTIDGMSKGGSPEAVVQIITPQIIEQSGKIEIIKTDTNGKALSGAYFTATDMGSNNIHYIGPTDANGYAYSLESIPYGNYIVRETVFPENYVSSGQSEWTVTVNSSNNGVVRINAVNALKKFRVSVTKSDTETETAQGNATLKGAVYGIYQGNHLIDTYTTDENGTFVTTYYSCGDGWTIKEITPSEGYLLDETVYTVGAESQNYSAQYNDISLFVKEQVIKGSVSIIKHSDNGTTQVETPEVGAEFQVYLKSAGAYGTATNTERDLLVTDENGNTASKLLPYGTYTVHQTKGKDGIENMKDFDVSITENGKIYSYIVNDAVITASVQIIKKDAETGKVIPASGIGFKVRNTTTGEFIIQHISYPTPMDIDVFYTDNTGSLMLPEKLAYGEYEIIEQTTANGYILDQTPIAFTVDGSKETVIVEKSNTAQKGVIKIEKTGEIFSTVTEIGGIYTPIYSETKLAGATLQIKAAEDIYTLDGTLRYAKDTVVDTVITDADGKAESVPLYLGIYSITEIEAPNGYVLDSTAYSAELTYAGQSIAVTTESVSIRNERQKANISLLKELEQDETFELGGSEQLKNVAFGLYAAEAITALDGSIIPADGLLESAFCDKNGEIAFTADIPFGKYYVKEISTDSHYILDGTKYPIDFTYAGQESNFAIVPVNAGLPIKNNISYGEITGLKTDANSSPLTGAVFGLFRTGETEFTKETALLTAISHTAGSFVFKNVPCGEWLVKELYCPEGYVLSDKTYEVLVTAQSNSGEEIVVVNYTEVSASKSPKTGDSARPFEFVLLISVSFSMIVLLIIKKQKMKGN